MFHSSKTVADNSIPKVSKTKFKINKTAPLVFIESAGIDFWYRKWYAKERFISPPSIDERLWSLYLPLHNAMVVHFQVCFRSTFIPTKSHSLVSSLFIFSLNGFDLWGSDLWILTSGICIEVSAMPIYGTLLQIWQHKSGDAFASLNGNLK